jgi:hypothetical protein
VNSSSAPYAMSKSLFLISIRDAKGNTDINLSADNVVGYEELNGGNRRKENYLARIPSSERVLEFRYRSTMRFYPPKKGNALFVETQKVTWGIV